MFRPRTISSTARISCRPFAMNTAPQVVSPAGMVTAAALLMALTMAIRRCTRAVKVTHSIMTSGGKSILLLRPVTRKAAQAAGRAVDVSADDFEG